MANLADAIFCEAYYQKCDRRWCGRKISRKNFVMFVTVTLNWERAGLK